MLQGMVCYTKCAHHDSLVGFHEVLSVYCYDHHVPVNTIILPTCIVYHQHNSDTHSDTHTFEACVMLSRKEKARQREHLTSESAKERETHFQDAKIRRQHGMLSSKHTGVEMSWSHL